ncbi:predicted protein [Arabidopsis lyrata subsp. lyrata]|uniref:Predicted protein n=1 Tax=Arabidopsis lyrata subsp. lyrata TaxID=81972 RepID=D7KLZ6_ARALL|nr:predicted protein [Arabidopsis lyrata subsp. lyrata]
MSDPENSVSPLGDSSSSQIKQQSYATVVNKRPALKKHDFEVSFVDGVPTIEVPSERFPSKVKVVEIEEGEVVEENGLARAESPVSVSGAVRFDSNGKSKEVPQDKTSEKTTEQESPLKINDTEGWSLVSPEKGRKSSEEKKNSLEVGQVTILSASRFSVLNDQLDELPAKEDESTLMTSKDQSEPIRNKADITATIETEKKSILVEKQSSLRATRNTKKSQKATSESLPQQAMMLLRIPTSIFAILDRS